jgi:soluble lytic murein transglycosylase
MWVVLAPLLMGSQDPGKTGHLDDLMPASDPRAAPLIAARKALDSGDAMSAVGHLSKETPPVDDFRSLLLARALAKEGKADQAIQAVARVEARAQACNAEPRLLIEARTLAANLLADRDPKRAAEMLLDIPSDGEVLALAISMLEKAKDPRAAETEVRLLIDVPDSLPARQLAKKLGAAGVTKKLGTTEKRMARVRSLLELHQNEDAAKEARALVTELGVDHALSCELGYLEGKANRKLRKYNRAIEVLVEARARCEKKAQADFAQRSALLEAQVRAIRGQVKGTAPIADWFVKNHKDSSFTDDALLLHAKLLEELGQTKPAEKAYQRMIDELPDGDETPEAAWQLANLAIEAKKSARAQELLGWILKKEKLRPIDRARARYWQARLLEDAKKKDEAVALYRELVREPSFYAWLALDGLARRDAELSKSLRAELTQTFAASSASVPLPEKLLAKAEFQRARLLFAAGASDLAQVELHRISCGQLSREELVAVALAFDRIGAYPDAQLVLRTRADMFIAKPIEPADVPIVRLAYSRPYLDLVERAATAEKLEALFLLALVREESTFDPKIVSWAGATGLAQLMPATAIGAYANVYKKRLTDMERLTDPELNLRLGAHVLKAGLDDWHDTHALALSAYNGGNGLTQKILPKQKVPFDRWVETIPVKETRGYVKRVIETWGIYRLLYDPKQPFIDLPDEINPGSE